MFQLTMDNDARNCTEIRAISDIMPAVLASYGLLEDVPEVEVELPKAELTLV